MQKFTYSNVSFEVAAATPIVALTAISALVDKANIKSGQKVSTHTIQSTNTKQILILGGSGGVGSYSIRFAKEIGAHVTTTCSGRNADYVRSLGADQVVDYTTLDFEKELAETKFDIIFDCVRVFFPIVLIPIRSEERSIFTSLLLCWQNMEFTFRSVKKTSENLCIDFFSWTSKIRRN